MGVAMQRPQRWDVPFGEHMTSAAVDRLLTIDPFRSMDPKRFTQSCSLEDILLNDARIVDYQPGDLVVREGDYGNSAFLILEGDTRVTLEALPDELLGRHRRSSSGWLKAIKSIVRGTRFPEVRVYGTTQLDHSLGRRGTGDELRIFLQDVPGVLDQYNTIQLTAGEFFGEVSALSRNSRSASVFAETPTTLLEIRWQGLRELMRRDPALKKHVSDLYRANSLYAHLRDTPLLANVSEEGLQAISDATEFESYGDFEWHSQYRKIRAQSDRERIQSEPVICEEQHYTNGLVLIRSGFARLSRHYGNGDLTMAYLGKGQQYGLEELIFNALHDDQVPLQRTLRAVGYVDILRIPTALMEEHVIPTLSDSTIRAAEKMVNVNRAESHATPRKNHADVPAAEIDSGLMEFIVENRFMNGVQTMIIDQDRCTRCDDCVRACASTHDNNPRFVRHGSTYDHFMIANACMHCVDPVCMIGCPTGAIGRDEATGNVLINDATCIGCSTCANSCPYSNIRMVEVRTPSGPFILDGETQTPIVKATKCDLCVDHWGGPACQRACPHDALVRMDMNNLPALADWISR